MADYKHTIQKIDNIRTKLNNSVHTELTLFDTTGKAKFWTINELTSFGMIPNNSFLSPMDVANMYNNIIETIPSFKQIPRQPIHVLSTKDKYNTSGKIMSNQQLTNIGCEYLFGKLNKFIEQAYFLTPEKTNNSIYNTAYALSWTHNRNQVSQTNKQLAANLSHAKYVNPNTIKEIWSLLWKTLFHIDEKASLYDNLKISSTPMNYMTPYTLALLNKNLQKIINQLYYKPLYSVDDVKKIVTNQATIMRGQIRQQTGEIPKLLKTDMSDTTKKIQNMQKQFYKQYYSESLLQK